MSESEEESVTRGGRSLRRRGGTRVSGATGRRLQDDSDTAESNGSDSGSEIEQPARKKKGKKILEEKDEAGPSGMQQQQTPGNESSEWESDWNSDDEQLLKEGGEKAAAALISNLGYASDSSTSSNESEKCPICLLSLQGQEIGVPEVCEHVFCAPCIEEWAKNVTTCPIDRKNFDVLNIYSTVTRKELLRQNKVQKKAPEDVPLLEDHELTYCEVCRRPDREDTMLLCDSCNLGYHMECLDPPLTEVPSGSWYCDCCFASGSDEDDEEVQDLLNDLNEIGGIRQNRLRERLNSPPRIVRTRQSERIRSAILTRTATNVRINVVQDSAQPGPSSRRSGASSSAVRTSSTSAATPARTTRKRYKRRTRRKILRMIISEYDVNDGDDKFAIKRTKIYKKLKKLSKKRSKRKLAKCRSNRKKKAVGLTPGLTDEAEALQNQRFSTGIPTLKLFGGANDLDYFSDEDREDMDADISTGPLGETAIQSIRASLRNPLGRRRVLKSGFEASSSSGPVDLLGSILESQERWHSSKGLGDVKINNGKIVFQIEKPQKKNANPPGAMQAGIGQNSQNNNNFSAGAHTGAADSTSFNRTAGPSQSVEYGPSLQGTSSLSGFGANDPNEDSVPDPSDMSIFVDLPPLKTPPREDEEKKKKNEGLDMFDIDSPIPLPPMNPAPEISEPEDSSKTVVDALAPGTSRGFGKFKFTMTTETNNCPNFSVYSSETLQYAKSGGEEPYDPFNSEQKTDDEFDERDEDLVQLDDEEPVVAHKPADSPVDTDQENIPNGTDKLPTGVPDHDAFESDSEDELKKIEEVSTPVGPEPEPTNELETLTPPLTTTVVAALACTTTAVKITDSSVPDTVITGDGITTTPPVIADSITASPVIADSITASPVIADSMAVSPGIADTETPPVSSPIEAANVTVNSAQGEEDRSYTPCLDEKYQEARREQDRRSSSPTLPLSTDGIDGMDTELISEEEENNFPEDETRPSSASKLLAGAKKKELAFKKVNKRGKDRNYRDKDGKKKDRNDDKENESRRSRERNRDRRPKRKEMPRYDVRTMMEKRPKPAKDPFGRDVTPKPRSKTRSRSRSPERRRELSISLSPEPPRRYTRRRSFSPRFRARNRTPPHFRRNVSRSPSRGPRMRSASRSRSRSAVIVRHRNPSRSRSPSPLRLRLPPRPVSRSPRPRSRSPEIRGAKVKKTKKKKRMTSPPASRSRSPSMDRSKKKNKKGRKKKTKRRSSTPAKKKKTRRRSISPIVLRSRSRSPSISNIGTTGVLTERFTKVRQRNTWTPPQQMRPKTNGTNLTVILTNEEALAKQARERDRKRREARRREHRARDKNLPSKEVFTSGDNILVSVSFNDKNLNKENQETADGPVSVAATQKRLKDMAKKRTDAEKAKRRRMERLKRTRGEAPKPVVIIDLDRSPFRVMTPSPRAIIVLSDSDTEKEKDRREVESSRTGTVSTQQPSVEVSTNVPSSTLRKSPVERHMEEDMFGPKTPPGFPAQQQAQPNKTAAPKFTMQVKSKQSSIRPLNLLYEPGELNEDKTPERMDNTDNSNMNYNMVGPNTPPEPAPQSPSPDVYDPFEPTKSPSPSPPRRDNASIERLSDLDDAVLPTSSGKVDGADSGTSGDPKVDSQNQDEVMNGEMEPPRGSKITILSNIVISQPANSGQGVVSGSGISASQHNTGDDSDVIFDDFVSSSAPAPSQSVGYSTTNSNPIKSYSTAANSSSLISKLPLPPGVNANQKFTDFINPTDSPYSPGASDFEDMFETGAGDIDSPPAAPIKQSYKPMKMMSKGAKKGVFDNLFGSSPNNNFKRMKKPPHKRRSKFKGDDDEDLSKLSAKERFLKKLNRLERVVEEVKLVIKPFYNKKQINKEEYKDILRRAVPKICHSRTGEINPIKIQKLIKAYVRKVRARRRLLKKGQGAGLAGGPLGFPGVNSNPMII